MKKPRRVMRRQKIEIQNGDASPPVRVLLDTHALLWWLSDDERLSASACAVIGNRANPVFVSAATAWELSTKHKLGKLPEHADIISDLPARLAVEDFTALAVTLDHGLAAGALYGFHKDPFDRMLIAQSRIERLAFVSNEQIFDAYGVKRIW